MTRLAARAFYLGRRPYAPVHSLQTRLMEARREGRLERDLVLLLEHEPVVTLGRAAKAGNVLLSAEALAERGVHLEETGRGGDVTFHGPGQLVGYPIVDLRPDRCDLRRYVRSLCELMVRVARDHDVEAGTVDGLVGVWVDADKPQEWATAAWARRLAKIGAVGVRVSRWVTMHGFALNLDVDLRHFDLIVPCGIKEHPVTSLAELVGSARSVRDVALSLGPHLCAALELEVEPVTDLAQADLEDVEAAVFASTAAARPSEARP
ncbi:MAG: lipoyl(octanoyl) transferase LipB [Polyangiaceae bacterium]|nr:lipoyl(octanoyl) transferase LipB [Polyangiaceae bacterium]MBK8938675.1 lipoyl(octanoyl) transferase LipB [Polyangiaceae bacterium]